MESKRRSNRGKWIALISVVLIGAGYYTIGAARPSFDAVEVAQAETRMWQAYYTDDKTALALELVAFMRNRYGLSLLEAKNAGEALAYASMKFRKASDDYEDAALGDLIEAYRVIQKGTGAPFDPEEAARAELAWWVARRTPGANSTEQVGAKIAALYQVLNGGEHPAFDEAGRLRAEAAGLRDAGGAQADWASVESLLVESYRRLAEANLGA